MHIGPRRHAHTGATIVKIIRECRARLVITCRPQVASSKGHRQDSSTSKANRTAALPTLVGTLPVLPTHGGMGPIRERPHLSQSLAVDRLGRHETLPKQPVRRPIGHLAIAPEYSTRITKYSILVPDICRSLLLPTSRCQAATRATEDLAVDNRRPLPRPSSVASRRQKKGRYISGKFRSNWRPSDECPG